MGEGLYIWKVAAEKTLDASTPLNVGGRVKKTIDTQNVGAAALA